MILLCRIRYLSVYSDLDVKTYGSGLNRIPESLIRTVPLSVTLYQKGYYVRVCELFQSYRSEMKNWPFAVQQTLTELHIANRQNNQFCEIKTRILYGYNFPRDY